MKLQHVLLTAFMSLLFFSCGKDKNIITLEAQTFEVLESITDAETIGKIEASSSEGAPLTFKLIENSDDLFTVARDGTTGLATGKRFNFNTAASHQIIVEASDGNKAVTTTITINLVSVLLSLEAQTFEVLETIAPGEEIGKIVATSSSSDPLSFRLVENPDDLFSLDIHTGQFTGKRQLNAKAAASHIIVVEVSDGFKTVSNTITINVIDVPDPFITTWKTDNYGESNDNQITIGTEPDLTYDYTVDWGDGTTDSSVTGNITHTYATAGTYTVSITGTFPQFVAYFGKKDHEKLITVEQWGDNQWQSMFLAFRYCKNLKINATDAPDLSQVSDTRNMFEQSGISDEDLSHWDVSNVTDMRSMFASTNFFNANISTWDVSNVTDMHSMFYEARAFNQDLNEWDMSSVTTTVGMFKRTTAFNGNIGNWNMSNVTTTKQMFEEAKAFNSDINNWDVSSVTVMADMFNGALSFNQKLDKWDITTVKNMSNMLFNTALSMSNYDALLLGWSQQKVKPNVSLGVGTTNYSGDGVAPRAVLTDTYNWTITDGGPDF